MNKMDAYFMDLAEREAKKATCDLIQVGAVIVKQGQVISTGANQAVKGQATCSQVGHLYIDDERRCIRQVHAETNAVLRSDRQDLVGATVYSTLEPCDNCTKILNQAGVKRVVFKERFKNAYNHHFIGDMEWICLENNEEEEA